MKKVKLKIDTPSIMFTSLTSKRWGRTFGFSAELSNGNIDPDVLLRACRDVRPYYPHVFSCLKKGFFWNYQQVSNADPEIVCKKENIFTPVAFSRSGRPDFRLVYNENKLFLEAAHCLGDGKGLLRFFETLILRYSELKAGKNEPFVPCIRTQDMLENAFDTYYEKGGDKATAKNPRAYHLPEVFEDGFLDILFASMSSSELKKLAHEKGMTVTEYMCAVLILGVLRTADLPVMSPVTVFVPVDLRKFSLLTRHGILLFRRRYRLIRAAEPDLRLSPYVPKYRTNLNCS